MSSDYAQGILTILSLVNPVICASIFARVAGGKSRGAKIADASKASFAIVVILSLAALGGSQVLRLFGISLPAFQVAGGLVLVWMGLTMLRGNSSPTTSADADSKSESLVPLILFAASPGTITGVITLSVTQSQHAIPVTALVSVVVAIGLTWLVMVVVARGSGAPSQGLFHDVSTRFMGLVVLAMGVQFALSGTQQFFQ